MELHELVGRPILYNRKKTLGSSDVKWIFGRGRGGGPPTGVVGVQETPETITAVHVVPTINGPPIVKAYMSENALEPGVKHAILKNFVIENNLTGLPSNYVLSTGEYSLNLVEAPAVPEHEIPQAMKWMLKDLIQFPTEEAVIDTFPLPFTRARDNAKMLYTVAARKTNVKEIEKLIGNSGLNLKSIDISELALLNIMNLLPQHATGGIFLQLEQKGGKLILCKDGLICISRSFEQRLEDLLVTSSDTGDKALELLELEIQRSIDYLSSMFRQSIPSIVLIGPNLLKKEFIQESLKKALNIDVVFFKLSDMFTFEKPLEEVDEMPYLLAIGAAIRQEEKA